MATSQEYEQWIKQLKWGDLAPLWRNILDGSTPEWDSGKAFEYLVVRAFELEGAQVRYPYTVNIPDSKQVMEQIDGIVYLGHLACMLEIKDTREAVNIEPIAKLQNQLLRRPASTIGVIFSRSGLTDPALELVRYNNSRTILFWEGAELDAVIELSQSGGLTQGVIRKYRNYVKTGDPIFDLRSEGI